MSLDIEDHAALREYLIRAEHICADEPVLARNLQGGVSNRAVWVELPSRNETWVVKQALRKLRVQVDWFSDPSRIEREALGLYHLNTLLRERAPHAITPLIFEDKKFYLLAMQAVPQPHSNWKELLLQGEFQEEHVRQFGRLLAAIHSESQKHGAKLKEIFEDRSFFESLRVEPYYEYSALQAPEAAPFMAALIEETRARREALTHGDYSPKNILIQDEQLVLLDHEVIHWGDPAFDVGFALAHLLSKAHRLELWRARFLEAALLFWREYSLAAEERTRKSETRCVRHALGCLLARVVGRSPLEYLGAEEKTRQREIVLALMREPPRAMDELIERFGARLASTS